MLSIATRSGAEYSIAADKRFVRMTHGLNDFQIKSVVKIESDTRIQWTNSASGAKYSVFVAPQGSTPVPFGSPTAFTESRLTGLSAGIYGLFIEAIDSAGNRKRSAQIAFQIK